METKQPIWKLLANLGDANPIDYGGYFVYTDETGVYPAEGEKLFAPLDSTELSDEEWTVYRFCLDRLKTVTDGANVYLVPFECDETWPHPIASYDEWFHKNLNRVAESIGQTIEQLREAFCSEDPRVRAFAYEAIGEHFGFDNLDSYPLTFTSREEVETRYKAHRAS